MTGEGQREAVLRIRVTVCSYKFSLSEACCCCFCSNITECLMLPRLSGEAVVVIHVVEQDRLRSCKTDSFLFFLFFFFFLLLRNCLGWLIKFVIH